jgi:hypothetical protein
MQDYKIWLEAKNNKIDAVMEIATALQKVFKKFSLDSRKTAWNKLTSKKGEKLIHELIRTPSQSLSPFRALLP